MNPYWLQLHAALRALTIEGPASYWWLGRFFSVSDAELNGARMRLAEDLAERLYREFYCPGMPAIRPLPVERPLAARAPFIEALSDANTSTGAWTTGWTVSSIGEGEIRARRSGLELLVPNGRLRWRGPGPPAVGEDVAVRYPKEFLTISPGHYVAVGDAPAAHGAIDATVRIYFNVSAADAPALVSSLTIHLNRARVPFRLKVLDDEGNFHRCDSAILYLPRASFHIAAPAIRGVAASLADGVPALTKRLCAGVGVAEDPRDSGESFGSHRCRLLADALVTADELGVQTFERRWSAVVQAFTDARLDVATPYLEPDSCDCYQL
jgi:hypothetical protein